MTKLEIAKTLLPLVNKAHKKGLNVGLNFTAHNIDVVHFGTNGCITFSVAIWDNDGTNIEYDYNRIFNYLKNLLK